MSISDLCEPSNMYNFNFKDIGYKKRAPSLEPYATQLFLKI